MSNLSDEPREVDKNQDGNRRIHRLILFGQLSGGEGIPFTAGEFSVCSFMNDMLAKSPVTTNFNAIN